MGGNAIPLSRSVSFQEAESTIEWFYKEIRPQLKAGIKTFEVIGSYGKKKDDETYGDIDIAVLVTDESDMHYISDFFVQLVGSAKINIGFGIISFGAPIGGKIENGIVQIDLMVTNNLDWSRFMNHSPDFRKNESQYKANIRNILLMAIITESQKEILKTTSEGEIEEIEVNILRYSKGIYRVRKNFMGKKGLVKNGKNTGWEEFVTNDPCEVTVLTVGKKYLPQDTNTFEKLWNIVISTDYYWKDKRSEIIKRFKECLKEQKLPEPKEIQNVYSELG
jgi:hypothetical protein